MIRLFFRINNKDVACTKLELIERTNQIQYSDDTLPPEVLVWAIIEIILLVLERQAMQVLSK